MLLVLAEQYRRDAWLRHPEVIAAVEESMADIDAGRVRRFENVEDLIADLMDEA